MKLNEIFSRIGCGEFDDKARRVSNVSSMRAQISADQIESGVTIETLQNIGVPVFRYQTQVTIHGVLPGFDLASRPTGYKALFQNQNGSIGVRYVAIDGSKKKLLLQASSLAKSAHFHAGIDSTGLHVSKFSMEKSDCIADFESLKALAHLFYGSVYAGACYPCGYMAVAEIGAIPVENLWLLISALFGISSQSQLESMQAESDKAEEKRREISDAEYKASQKQREADEAKALSEACARLAASGHRNTVPAVPGQFIVVSYGWSGLKIMHYKVAKGSFGRMLYSVVEHGSDFVTGMRQKVADAHMRQWWQKMAAKNLVFTV